MPEELEKEIARFDRWYNSQPEAWQAVLREFSIQSDPLAEALLPDVLKLMFGLRIVRDRQSLEK